MTIIFDVKPFSMEAMDIAKEIEEQAESAIEGTNLSNARVALDGKSAQNADLQTISSDDFSRTVIIMLIGIGMHPNRDYSFHHAANFYYWIVIINILVISRAW